MNVTDDSRSSTASFKHDAAKWSAPAITVVANLRDDTYFDDATSSAVAFATVRADYES